MGRLHPAGRLRYAALEAVDARLVGVSNEDLIETLQEAVRGDEA